MTIRHANIPQTLNHITNVAHRQDNSHLVTPLLASCFWYFCFEAWTNLVACVEYKLSVKFISKSESSEHTKFRETRNNDLIKLFLFECDENDDQIELPDWIQIPESGLFRLRRNVGTSRVYCTRMPPYYWLGCCALSFLFMMEIIAYPKETKRDPRANFVSDMEYFIGGRIFSLFKNFRLRIPPWPVCPNMQAQKEAERADDMCYATISPF